MRGSQDSWREGLASGEVRLLLGEVQGCDPVCLVQTPPKKGEKYRFRPPPETGKKAAKK